MPLEDRDGSQPGRPEGFELRGPATSANGNAKKRAENRRLFSIRFVFHHGAAWGFRATDQSDARACAQTTDTFFCGGFVT